MYTNRGSLAIALSIGVLAQCESSSQTAIEKLFLLEDAAQQQWCIYRNEAEWKGDVEQQDAMVVATVEHTSGRVAAVNVTEQDETGDWIVYDNYVIGADGQLQSLNRTVNILPGERREQLVFQLRAGRASQQSRTTARLGTDKPLPNAETWLPDVPVVTTTEAFPFASLIGAERLKTLPPKLCVPTGLRERRSAQ
jgi:hypothetical protein